MAEAILNVLGGIFMLISFLALLAPSIFPSVFTTPDEQAEAGEIGRKSRERIPDYTAIHGHDESHIPKCKAAQELSQDLSPDVSDGDEILPWYVLLAKKDQENNEKPPTKTTGAGMMELKVPQNFLAPPISKEEEERLLTEDGGDDEAPSESVKTVTVSIVEDSGAPASLGAKDGVMSDDAIKALLEKLFDRYDLDGSGLLDSEQEWEMLTVNAAWHIGIHGSLDDILAPHRATCTDEDWDLERYMPWFFEYVVPHVPGRNSTPGRGTVITSTTTTTTTTTTSTTMVETVMTTPTPPLRVTAPE